MTVTAATRLTGLLGWPLSHTRSPHMHNAAFDALKLDLLYLPLPVAPKALKTAVAAVRAFNFLGVNVTIPHKEAVLALMDDVSDESRLIGAVNTVVNRNGRLYGTTTDPHGIRTALKGAGAGFRGRRVTILGTGGSARTALFTALMDGCTDACVAGRRPARARALASDAKRRLGCSNVFGLDLNGKSFAARMADTDLLVNATSVGMHPHPNASPLSAALLSRGQTVFDMVYNPRETRLLRDAKAKGAVPVYGLGMLVGQGMESFRLWTGKKAPEAAFLKGATLPS